MNIPSLGQLVGLIVSAIVVLNASGKGHLVWTAIYEMRQKCKISPNRDHPISNVGSHAIS